MFPRAPGLVALRVLAGLQGLPLLVGFLWGALLVVTSLLDQEGVNDGFGLLVGGFLLAVTSVPLLVVVAAVVGRNPTVVRTCGFIVGVGSVVCAWLWSEPDLGHGLDLAPFLPGVLTCVLAVGSAIAAYGAPLQPERRLPVRVKGEG